MFNDVNSSYDELEEITKCLLKCLKAYSSLRILNILRNCPLRSSKYVLRGSKCTNPT